jgi:hypothetical protein
MATRNKSPRDADQEEFYFPLIQKFAQQPRAGWILAVVYGVVMLIVNLAYHRVGDYNVETDFYWSYIPQAQHLLQGHMTIEDFHGPLYPIVLALLSLVTQDLFHAGVIVSTVSAAVALFFAYELFRRWLRAEIAFAAVVMMGLNTTFVQHAYSAGTDMLFNALVIGGTFFLLKDDKQSWRSLLIAAVLFALGYLTRYNGLFVIVAVPAVMLLVNPFGHSWRDRVITAAVFVAAFIVLITPWGLYCLREKGSFFYNKNYLNIAYEMFARNRMTWDQFWSIESQRYTSLSQVVFLDVEAFFKNLLNNALTHGASDIGKLLGWPVGVCSLLGFFLLFRRTNDKRELSFLVLAAGFYGVLLLVFYSERFSLFLLPAYLALAFRALTDSSVARIRFGGRLTVARLLVAALVVWTASASYLFNSRNIDSGPVEVLSIAEGFQNSGEQVPPGTIVVTRKPHIAYYLKMQMVLFPLVHSYDELEREVRTLNASYLYFSYVEAQLRPEFRSLLEIGSAPPWLKPVAFTSFPPAVLYKVQFAKP